MEISFLILSSSLVFFLLGITSPMQVGCGVFFFKELGLRAYSYFMHCDRRIVFLGSELFVLPSWRMLFAYNITQVPLSTMLLTIPTPTIR